MPPARTWPLILGIAGAGAALVLSRPAPLADSASCPGMADLAVVIAARTWRDLTMGTILAWSNITWLMIAFIVCARVVYVATSSYLITLATILCLATSPLLLSPWAPTPVLAVAACAAAWLAGVMVRRRAAALATFMAGAAAAPALALLFAGAAGWIAWRTTASQERSRQVVSAVVAVLAVLAVPAIVTGLMSSPVACVWPRGSAFWSTDGWKHIWSSTGATPLAGSLALLGFFTSLPRTVLLLGVPVAVLYAGVATGSFVPAVLVFWMLCALGLADVGVPLARSRGSRAAIAVFATALVGFQVLHMRTGQDPGDRQTSGHAGLSRTMMVRVVGAVPAGAVLLAEDAITDLLIRALPADMRARRRLQVPYDADTVTEELRAARVFALPRAQRYLQHHGFKLAAANPPMPGLAEVQAVRPCSAPLTTTWQQLPDLAEADHFTMTAGNPQSYGAVFVFVGSGEPLAPQALDWTPSQLRGFHPRGHALADTEGRRQFLRDIARYGVDEAITNVLAMEPHVSRIELWRTPDAPLVLTVNLGGRPRMVFARLADNAMSDQMRLCPLFPYHIEPIERPARD